MIMQIEDPNSSNRVVGLDFGTTRSVVAICDGENCSVVKIDALGFLPSIAYVDGRRFASIKRILGLREADKHKDLLPYELSWEEGYPRILIDGAKYDVHVLVQKILRKIRLEVASTMGEKVNQAVITVPACFDYYARQLIYDNAQLAGWNISRILSEPVAASLAHRDIIGDGVYGVYDLGGGTFDFSVVRIEGDVTQVLSTGGSIEMGGDDVDRALFHKFSSGQQCFDDSDMVKVMQVIQKGKEDAVNLGFSNLQLGARLFELTKNDVEQASASLIRESLDISDSVIADSHAAISGIVLSGGSSALPGIFDALEQRYQVPIHHSLPSSDVVAMGAARYANGIKQRSHLLMDVISASIGVMTFGDEVAWILHKNQPIPARETEGFSSLHSGKVNIRIVQSSLRGDSGIIVLRSEVWDCISGVLLVTLAVDHRGNLTAELQDDKRCVNWVIDIVK